MDNTENKETNVTLDGQTVNMQQIQEAEESCGKNDRIKEVKPGEYRKQKRMYS